MKLRNKKTGEIKDIDIRLLGTKPDRFVGSIAELNADWEDYEEPKEYYYLDYGGRIKAMNDANDEEDMARKAIGNYFETKEEAKKALERLRAWKRLKDKGFRFDGYDVAHNSNGDLCGQLFYNAGDYCIADVEENLDELFGGEE